MSEPTGVMYPERFCKKKKFIIKTNKNPQNQPGLLSMLSFEHLYIMTSILYTIPTTQLLLKMIIETSLRICFIYFIAVSWLQLSETFLWACRTTMLLCIHMFNMFHINRRDGRIVLVSIISTSAKPQIYKVARLKLWTQKVKRSTDFFLFPQLEGSGISQQNNSDQRNVKHEE